MVIQFQRQRRNWFIDIRVAHTETTLKCRTQARDGIEETIVLPIPEGSGIRHHVTLRPPVDISLLDLYPLDGDAAGSVSLNLDDPWLG